MDKEYAKYILEKTRDDYNRIAEDFSRTRDKPWPEIRFLFDNYLNSGDKVLDFGCGNGRFFEFFKDKNLEYIGLDPSDKLIEIAKSRYPRGNFHSFNLLEKLSFPNNSFDKVYSIAVLHHIPSEQFRLDFLKELERVLKPGGLLIFTVWKFHRPKEIFLIFKFKILRLFSLTKLDKGDVFEPWGKKFNRYYHCFSKKELVKLIEKTNLKIKDIRIVKNEQGNRRNIYLIAEK